MLLQTVFSKLQGLPKLRYVYMLDCDELTFCYTILGGMESVNGHGFLNLIHEANGHLDRLLSLYDSKYISTDVKDNDSKYFFNCIRDCCNCYELDSYTINEQFAYLAKLSDEQLEDINRQMDMYCSIMKKFEDLSLIEN